MAFNLINSTLWQPGGNGGDSSSVNFSGSDLIIIGINSINTIVGSITVSDTSSNTWNPLTAWFAAFTAYTQFWYAWNAVSSSTQVFTVTNLSSFYPTLIAVGYSGSDTGSDPFHAENGDTTFGDSLNTGNVSVASTGDLVVSALGNNTGGNTPTSSYTIEEGSPFVGGTAYSGWYADKLSGSGTESDTWGNLGSVGSAVGIATFRQAAGATGGGPLMDNGELVNGGALVKGRLVNYPMYYREMALKNKRMIDRKLGRAA